MIMYRLRSCLVFIVAAIAAEPAIADPQYNGVFVARVGSKPSDITLERQMSKIKARVKMLGMGGATVVYIVPGERSSVRFSAADNISFLVRYPDAGADPMSIFIVSSAVVRKGNREFGGYKSGFLSLKSDAIVTQPVPFTPTPYKAGILRLALPSKLAPGEYCASTAQSFQNPEPPSFCFGID